MRKLALLVAPLLCLLTALALSSAGRLGSRGKSYEMTTYYVALLYRGAKWTPEVTPETERHQKEHLANIQRMVDSGKLILAGPFSENTDLRGMFVFQVSSREEAQALAEADPAVKAGRLKVDLHEWYAPKGIRVVQPTNDVKQ